MIYFFQCVFVRVSSGCVCVCVCEREREILVKKYQDKKVIKRHNLKACFKFYFKNSIHFKHNICHRKRSEHSRDDWDGVKPSRRKLAIHLFRHSDSSTASEILLKNGKQDISSLFTYELKL